MKFRMARLVVIILILMLLTGCKGKVELDERAIVSSMGIDKVDDKYLLTVQVINPKGLASADGGGGGDKAPVYNLTTEGHSISEALDKAKNHSPRKLFLSHIYYIVIGETFARENGMKSVLDFIERDVQMRMQFNLFIAKDGTAKNILSIFTQFSDNPGKAIQDRIETASIGSLGIDKDMSTVDIFRAILDEGDHPVVLGIEDVSSPGSDEVDVLKNISGHSFDIKQVGIFREDKLEGWYNEQETRGFIFLNNILGERSIFHIQCPGGNAAGRLYNSSTKIDSSFRNNILTFNIKVNGKANLIESSCDLDLSAPEEIDKLKKELNNQIENEIRSTVDKIKEIKYDAVGLGQYFQMQHPSEWEKQKKSWNEMIEGAEFHYEINIDIDRIGMRFESADEKDTP
ncbi:Ger(x)C family spore germination protein [Evansella sp. LMS18]|uniref:Ger(x)C family spore germination protein n=1 Tax=Evansella sp. LMS18 TaxID=2924033 RepID=UPI0020D02F6C|nr:Ger(x)C family spore germination protein [Evansella sp. LMS18]UTR10232.1 Ger(x)C family spore germination protein [Evansella sp. LMS18]